MVTGVVQLAFLNPRHLPFDTTPFSVLSPWICETWFASRSKSKPLQDVRVQISACAYLEREPFLIKQKSPDAPKQLKTISKDSAISALSEEPLRSPLLSTSPVSILPCVILHN